MQKDGNQGTFQRIEKKYMLSQKQYDKLMERLQERLVADEFFHNTICNIYYDTADYRLIRTSLEKPPYKEKLRLRSYGVPGTDNKVFLEIKKKYDGIVYKRRETMTPAEAERYMESNLYVSEKSQIIREIDWMKQFYGNLQPMVFLAYDREAYVVIDNPQLRITFDTNILWRDKQLCLGAGMAGSSLLEKGQHLMEIKIPGAMPLWLAHLLNELNLRQTSFSKYGHVYQYFIMNQSIVQGGLSYA